MPTVLQSIVVALAAAPAPPSWLSRLPEPATGLYVLGISEPHADPRHTEQAALNDAAARRVRSLGSAFDANASSPRAETPPVKKPDAAQIIARWRDRHWRLYTLVRWPGGPKTRVPSLTAQWWNRPPEDCAVGLGGPSVRLADAWVHAEERARQNLAAMRAVQIVSVSEGLGTGWTRHSRRHAKHEILAQPEPIVFVARQLLDDGAVAVLGCPGRA